MIRITTWRQVQPSPVGTSPVAVIDAFRDLTQSLRRVPGAGDVQWGFGSGGIVTVGNVESYAVADAILKDSAVQAAGVKVFLLGIGIAVEVFVISPEQGMPVVPQQGAVAPTA